MAVFKFRLASVLRVREHFKDQKQAELRALHETRQRMAREIDALENELAANGAAPQEGEIFTAIELRLRAQHGQALANRIQAKRTALTEFGDKLAEKRAEAVEAMRAVKSLEQLRQRHEERYWREQNGAEQRFSDEIAQRSFARHGDRKKIPE